jgi:putative ABC transport system permease protein
MREVLVAIRIAFESLGRQGYRSWLTSLGILIGIAAVVVVVSLGEGAREQVTSQLSSLGSNLIYVFPRSVPKSGVRIASVPSGLTMRDLDALRRGSSAAAITAYVSTRAMVVSEFANEQIDVVGSDQSYLEVRGYSLSRGRNLTANEVETKARVLLLGSKARSRLFGEVDPVGRRLRIGRHSYVVIGELTSKGQSPFGADQDDRVVMPIGSWFARIAPSASKQLNIIMLSARTPALIEQTEQEARLILRERRLLAEAEEDDFTTATQRDFQATQDRIQGVLSILLLSVASISLFVGGVGVTNMMLVNVHERRREIGLRLAVGAEPADISLQFLMESVGLTVIGGILGLLLAVVVVTALQRAFGGILHLNLNAVVVAIGTSLVVGLASGAGPAYRASRLDPIEALRHE